MGLQGRPLASMGLQGRPLAKWRRRMTYRFKLHEPIAIPGEAARELGLSRVGLANKIKRYAIEPTA